jgi:hypothetical protein
MFISIQLIFKSKIIEVDKYIDNRKIITIFKKTNRNHNIEYCFRELSYFKLKDTCL